MLLSTDFTGPSLAESLAMDKCGEEVSAWVLVGVCFLAFLLLHVFAVSGVDVFTMWS